MAAFPISPLPIPARALLCGASIVLGIAVMAQGTWRLDSLMRSWYVQRTIQEKKIPFSRHFGPDSTEVRATWTDTSPALPAFHDGEVARAIELYGGTRRTEFRLLLGVAEVYRPMIAQHLEREGLPAELADLPMALSAMNVQCYSERGEGGLWMLTWPVAIRYGLRITADVDERRNDVKSTIVACRYLKELHARYTDWPMAVLAFACGPAQLEAARIRSNGESTVQMLYPYLDAPYRDLVPTLIAMHWLAHEASGPHPRPIPSVPWEPMDTVHFPTTVRFASVVRATNVPDPHLHALNPELTGKVVPAEFPFHLPHRTRFNFSAVVDSMLAQERASLSVPAADTTVGDSAEEPAPPGTSTVYYRIKSGDALGTIAQRHKVTIAQLKEWNDLKSDAIDVGEELMIHVPEPGTSGKGTQRGSANAAKSTSYTVRSGDTLDAIAKRHPGVTAQEIMRLNKISAKIRPGQRILIPSSR